MDEKFISNMVKTEVAKWFQSQHEQTSGYDFEQTFVECWRDVGQKVFQECVGKIPGSKNEKKTQMQFRRDYGS